MVGKKKVAQKNLKISSVALFDLLIVNPAPFRLVAKNSWVVTEKIQTTWNELKIFRSTLFDLLIMNLASVSSKSQPKYLYWSPPVVDGKIQTTRNELKISRSTLINLLITNLASISLKS